MRDPFAPIDVVSITDPSVVFASPEARAEYVRTRDPSLWKPAANGRAAVFTLRPLGSPEAVRLEGLDPGTRVLLAFRACCIRVALPDGATLEARLEGGYLLGSLAPESWVTEVATKVGPRRVYEIGEAAYRLSMLDDLDPLLPPPGQPLQP